MKTYITLLLLTLLSIKSPAQVKAAAQKTSPYHFKLKVTEKPGAASLNSSKLNLDLYQIYSNANIILKSQIHAFDHDINGLDTLITMPSSDADLRMDYERNGKTGKNFYSTIKEYFVSDGDILDIDLYPDSLIFKGRDAHKFNLQTQLFALNYNISSKILKQDETYFEQLDKVLQNNLNAQFALLNRHKIELSPQLYTYLSNQIIGIRCYRLLGSAMSSMKLDPAISKRGINYFLSREKDLPKVNNPLAHRSSYWSDYLLARERLRIELKNNLNLNSTIGAAEILDTIAKKYTGNLRDRLLVTGVVNLSRQYLDADSYFLSRNGAIPKSSRYYEISNLIKNAFSGKSKAFAFALPDSAGKIVKLEDFKGKAVVVDYWFTGCTGCILLQKAIAPVYEHFKDNKDVVFLSICADRETASWKKSLQSGKYTHPQSINLITNGFRHEMIIHYNITTYPKLMLIDRNGNLIARNMIHPGNKEEAQQLIEQIEDATSKR